MDTNLQELRKEAYRIWGLKPRQVIYNMQTSKNELTFKLDYSPEKQAWPKAYSLSVSTDNQQNEFVVDRIIFPIKIIRKIGNWETSTDAWYDIPTILSDKIVALVKGPEQQKRTSGFKKLLNRVLPKNMKFNTVVPVEDYIFQVTNNNNELEIELLIQ